MVVFLLKLRKGSVVIQGEKEKKYAISHFCLPVSLVGV